MQGFIDFYAANGMLWDMSNYYLKKYPFNYPFVDTDGSLALMCTIDMPTLVKIYTARMAATPQSFFDCGAAVGFMVDAASRMGMRARGIDVRAYPTIQPMGNFSPYFASGRIKIESILDTAPVRADLAYCNGTLTYLNDTTLPLALSKFGGVGMLVAVHNTTEDLVAAAAMGDPIVHSEPRLIRPNAWWMDTLCKNGFDVDFDTQYGCFCARPSGRRPARILSPADIKAQEISLIPKQYVR